MTVIGQDLGEIRDHVDAKASDVLAEESISAGAEPLNAAGRRRRHSEEVLAELDATIAAGRTGRVDVETVHELGCSLQEAQEETLVALERLTATVRFTTSADAATFLSVCDAVDAASLVAEELRLLSAVARWRVLAAHGREHAGEFRARLVALIADRLRIQGELAHDIVRDLGLWRPTPYWSLRNVVGGDYPRGHRGWSAASRAAFHLRDEALEALRELQLATPRPAV